MLSTHVTCNHRLTAAWLNRVESAGIAAVEIFCAKQHFDWANKSQVAELGHFFRDSQLKLHSLHAPMYTDEIWGRSGPESRIDITERKKATRIQWVGELKRAIEVAEIIPFRYLIQHLGVTGQEFSEYAVEAAFSSLEELALFARQRGVEILLENIPNELSTAERLESFNAVTHLKLNYVFDTGHANLAGSIAGEYETMQARIRSLHVHDNNGKDDQHLLPFSAGATTNWQETMNLLRSRPGQYPLLLELRDDATLNYGFDDIARTFDQLEALENTHA